MMGKLVICAVLCVAISQVCFAQPAQSERVLNPFQSNDEDFETRITTCRSHIREAVNAIAAIVYNFTSLCTEILASLSDGVRCVIRPAELPSCISGLVADTFDGMFNAIKDVVINILHLLVMIMKALVQCLMPVGYKQLLTAFESGLIL